MAAPECTDIEQAIEAIRSQGVSLPLVHRLLSACGFRQRARKPPYQRLARDGTVILAFPRSEKPIAFFPFRRRQYRWQEDVHPCLQKCWEADWTGTGRGTGRAFLVTERDLRAYVLPVPPQPGDPIEPAGVLSFDEARRRSSDLLLLQEDTISAPSYWDFLRTPTADVRDRVNRSLLDQLEQWANALAGDLAQRRPGLSAEQADDRVRRLLDQLLFVRFCEDRRVTALRETLFDFRGDTLDWSKLRGLMGQYQCILNGDVFDPEAFADGIVDPGLVQNILLHLYQDYSFEVIPSDVLGRTYEQRLALRLVWSPPTARYVEDEGLRKQYGIYYTPEPVAAYLAGRAFDIWLPRATKRLEDVRLLDPCAGSGTLLVQGFRALVERLRGTQGVATTAIPIAERARLLGECVFGLDIKRVPLERSALACYFEALSGRGVASGQRLLPHLLGHNLLTGDAHALTRSLPDGFQADIILLNPPYTGHASASAPCWRILREALAHLAENGVLGAIVPDALLRNERLARLRKSLLDSAAIEEFGLIRTRVFEKPNVRPILLLLRKVRAAEDRMAHVPRSVFIRTIEPEVETDPVPRTASQAALVRPPLYAFSVHVADAITEIQTRLLDSGRLRKLKEFLRDCSCGIMNAPADTVHKAAEAPKDVICSAKEYLQGKDIKLFRVASMRLLMDYAKVAKAGMKEGSGVRAREPGLFEVPCKLLVRRTGRVPQACLDFAKRYVDDKVIVCLPSPRACDSILLHFLLGYLNSEVGWFWFRLMNPQDPAYMPSLRQEDLESLWVPVGLDHPGVTRVAVLSHRIAQTLASGYVKLGDERIVGMRRQLLVTIATLLGLDEKDVNLILDFLNEPHSVAERPFKYPRRILAAPFIKLPPRPPTEEAKGELWDEEPLSEEERRKKADWEDIINGPLPDIYERRPDEEALSLGRELKEFEERLGRLERLLRGGDKS